MSTELNYWPINSCWPPQQIVNILKVTDQFDAGLWRKENHKPWTDSITVEMTI